MMARMKTVAAILGFAGVGLMSMSANAATTIKGDIKEFTPLAATQNLNVKKPDSWFNLTMGYKGWTHHSSWGYMKLVAGKEVTITVDASANNGFHPGISVWHRPQRKGLVPLTYAYDHFYSQWDNIVEKNVKVGPNEPNDPGKDLGTMKMYFITNGFDRDGMADPLPMPFDQGPTTRIVDGKVGVVSVKFIPQESGYYQFVIGGINPDVGAACPNMTCPVSVSVKFPQ
jgi:hypothetical protein